MSRLSQDDINRIFGMSDALKKLDELVDMATLGGKKEKPKSEPVNDDETEFYNAIHEMARHTHMMYEAYKDEGFDDDQAFELTIDLCRQFNGEA